MLAYIGKLFVFPDVQSLTEESSEAEIMGLSGSKEAEECDEDGQYNETVLLPDEKYPSNASANSLYSEEFHNLASHEYNAASTECESSVNVADIGLLSSSDLASFSEQVCRDEEEEEEEEGACVIDSADIIGDTIQANSVKAVTIKSVFLTGVFGGVKGI